MLRSKGITGSDGLPQTGLPRFAWPCRPFPDSPNEQEERQISCHEPRDLRVVGRHAVVAEARAFERRPLLPDGVLQHDVQQLAHPNTERERNLTTGTDEKIQLATNEL